MTEQPFDLRLILRLIRRRRTSVLVLGLMGTVLALAFGVLLPPRPTAEALVQLPPVTTTGNGTPTRDMATQKAVATSSPVLAMAGQSLAGHPGVDVLRKAVRASGLSQDILIVRATEPVAARAEQVADAVAAAYVTYVTAPGSNQSQHLLSGLQAEQAQLATQISKLQSSLGSASSGTGTALAESIRDELAVISAQLDTLGSKVGISNPNSLAGTRVLQRADSVATVSAYRLPFLALIGLVAGTLVGSVVAVVLGRWDRRLRRRDELASALGIPVVASLQTATCRTASDWRRVLETYEPGPLDEWNLRRVLTHVRSDPQPHAVGIVSFADDVPALAAGPQLAVFAASFGVPTSLVPHGGGAITDLRAAGWTAMRDPIREPLLSIQLEDDPLFEVAAQLTVDIETAEMADPEIDQSGHTRRALIAVSAGFATADELARLALACRDADYSVEGLLVVNPDPSDTTVGAVAPSPGPDGPDVRPAPGSGPAGTRPGVYADPGREP